MECWSSSRSALHSKFALGLVPQYRACESIRRRLPSLANVLMVCKAKHNLYSFITLLSNRAVASEEWLAISIKFRVWCAKQLTIVRNWLPAVLYTVQDQRILVTAKFGTVFNISYEDSAPLVSTSAHTLKLLYYVGPPLFLEGYKIQSHWLTGSIHAHGHAAFVN